MSDLQKKVDDFHAMRQQPDVQLRGFGHAAARETSAKPWFSVQYT